MAYYYYIVGATVKIEMDVKNDIEISRGETAFNERDYTTAVDILLTSVHTDESVNRFFTLLSELEEGEDYEDVIVAADAAYRSLIGKNANDEKALLLWAMGRAENYLGKYEDAKAHLEVSREIAENTLSTEDIEGIDKDMKAVQLEFAKKEASDKALEFITQGKLLEQSGKYREAIDIFTLSLKYEPSLQGFFYRGRCWNFLEDCDNALKDFESALEIHQSKEDAGKDYPILYYIGTIRLKLGDYESAVSYLHRAEEHVRGENTSKDYNLIVSALDRAQEQLEVILSFIIRSS